MDCFTCDYEGTRQGLGQHYGFKPDHRPSLTEEQRQIITGLLMGDGHINRSSKNARLRAEMINREYLEYVDSKFPHIGCGLTKSRTAESQSQLHRETGFNKNASAETYSDCYWWETMTHHQLNEYAEWYQSGKKLFPEEIELTPTVLKHWYVCDGNIKQDKRVRIYLNNEKGNKDKIESYFSEFNSPRWELQPTYTAIIFDVSTSDKLLEYMGEPLPGFKYKWAERFK